MFYLQERLFQAEETPGTSPETRICLSWRYQEANGRSRARTAVNEISEVKGKWGNTRL